MAQPGNRKVFFAWQSDTRAEFNKDLVWDALQTACKELNDDAEMGPDRDELGADRDTQGVAGSGDVHRIIFEKLEKTDLAIFDLSAVAKTDGGKAVPNPNVMLELGFATKAITEARIALIANEAVKHHGALPFDLRNRRTIFYRCSKAEHVAEAKAKLIETLRDALRDMSLAMPERESTEMAVLRAVREGRPDARSLARSEGTRLTAAMLSWLPDKRLLNLDQVKEVLKKARGDGTGLLNLAAACLSSERKEIFLDVIGAALERLVSAATPAVSTGTINEQWVDSHRMLARELFLQAVALCSRQRNWGALRELLLQHVEYKDARGAHASEPFQRIWLFPSLMSRDIKPYIELLRAECEEAKEPRATLEELRDAETLVAIFEESEAVAVKGNGVIQPWFPYLILAADELPAPIARSTSAKTVKEQMTLLNRDWDKLSEAHNRLKARLIEGLVWSRWSMFAAHTWPAKIAAV